MLPGCCAYRELLDPSLPANVAATPRTHAAQAIASYAHASRHPSRAARANTTLLPRAVVARHLEEGEGVEGSTLWRG